MEVKLDAIYFRDRYDSVDNLKMVGILRRRAALAGSHRRFNEKSFMKDKKIFCAVLF